MRVCLAVFAVISFLFCAASSFAAEPKGMKPTALTVTDDTKIDRPASIVQAETYLRGLVTAKARFLQTAPDGTQLIGTFYLNRPGKLRFEYDDPIKDFVVADGFFIYFYDSQLQQQTNAPIGQTLADFLLRADLHLSGDVKVTKVERGGELLKITLIQTNDPDAGSLTLGFKESPFELKKWRVVDAQGAITEVELFQLQSGVKLAGTLFVYTDPKTGGKPSYNE
jgi:outer membrane lipoprotein-sorting protein